jgi:uncharacterized membrane protein YfcA
MVEVLIGFLIAILIALTGVGAGVITAPLLILFMGVPMEAAVSTALAYSALVKLIVVPAQIARRQVNYRVLGYMLLGGLPGVIFGSLMFKHVAAHGPRAALSFALGAIILFTSGWNIFRHFRPAGIRQDRRLPPAPDTSTTIETSKDASTAIETSADVPMLHIPPDRSRWLALIMLPIGAEVGFSSSGAGALGTVSLMSLTNLSASQVVGTDLAFGLGIALVGSGVHAMAGHYATAILIRMSIGGVLGGLVGTNFAPKIPNRTLRLALCIWLAVIGLDFCWKALLG